jgi:uncharacterized protein
MHVSALNIHPVKSLRGMSVSSAEVDDLGAVGDRRFLVIDPKGDFITQRSVPRMATVDAFLGETTLTLRAAEARDLVVRRAPDAGAKLVSVRIWKSEGLMAEDCGIEAAAWLSCVLGVECRLVRVGPAFRRPVLKPLAKPDEVVHFADAGPFLAVNEASVEELNHRIGKNGGSTVTVDRFRTNLVVAGFAPFAEDHWKRIKVGSVVFRSLGPSARCIVTTTDQMTGDRGVEPLRTLATFRRDPAEPSNVIFGQNLVNESKSGVIRVGDAVEVLE